jgi:hypothetical protein
MRKLLQNLNTGKTELVEEPASRMKIGHVLDKVGDQKSEVEGSAGMLEIAGDRRIEVTELRDQGEASGREMLVKRKGA